MIELAATLYVIEKAFKFAFVAFVAILVLVALALKAREDNS